jgi:RNA polymerase sigma-70 factor (ECF subfamily)
MTLLSPEAGRFADEREFRAMVEPYRRVLEIHCYRMLGSVHDAEDVVQEALLRAWRSLDRFERRSSVQTWLYRIATNACLDELERRPRRPEPMVDPYPDDRRADLEAEIADPAARYAQREGMEIAFLTAIQRLPGRQRAVLILRDVLGWSAAEAADLLDTTVTAVNSALQRGRATIEDAVPAPRPTPHREDERVLLKRYVDAWQSADVDGLVALLHEDAVITMPPERAIHGAAAIADFFAKDPCRVGATATLTSANGSPAWRSRASDGTERLVLVDIVDGRVATMRAYVVG